mmetsp:Transcript_20887/g.30671  ORF Transcript_20887/g.30671 Transcript_20887/m.30671 type:complete len:81 (+) Transcript_20887:68-310(+)
MLCLAYTSPIYEDTLDMCVCMCLCLCMCVCLCVYVYVHIFNCIYTYISMFFSRMHAYEHARYACVRANAYASTCIITHDI